MKSSKKQKKEKKNAFSVLMSSKQSVEKKKRKKGISVFRRNKQRMNKMFPPKYKQVRLTGELLVLVDAFEYAIPKLNNQESKVLNMLTHFHSDHYGGLDRKYSSNVPILCNEVTGNLVVQELRVCKSRLQILPMNTYIHLSNGVDVAMIDANHCPGAAMALFRVKTREEGTFRYILHTGDFRYSPKCHLTHPLLSSICLDTVYLDDTYCNEMYCFPNQNLVLRQVKDIALTELSKYKRTLFLFGAYAIGKEKVFLSVVKSKPFKDSKIFVEKSRHRRFQLFNWSKSLLKRFTTNPSVSNIHVVTMGKCRAAGKYAEKWSKRYDAVVTFVPTGWNFSTTTMKKLPWFKCPIRKRHGTLQVLTYMVPYSEHSSFDELVQFINDFDPKNVISTVNVSSQDYNVKLLRNESLKRRVSGDYDNEEERVIIHEEEENNNNTTSDLGKLLSIVAD